MLDSVDYAKICQTFQGLLGELVFLINTLICSFLPSLLQPFTKQLLRTS